MIKKYLTISLLSLMLVGCGSTELVTESDKVEDKGNPEVEVSTVVIDSETGQGKKDINVDIDKQIFRDIFIDDIELPEDSTNNIEVTEELPEDSTNNAEVTEQLSENSTSEASVNVDYTLDYVKEQLSDNIRLIIDVKEYVKKARGAVVASQFIDSIDGSATITFYKNGVAAMEVTNNYPGLETTAGWYIVGNRAYFYQTYGEGSLNKGKDNYVYADSIGDELSSISTSNIDFDNIESIETDGTETIDNAEYDVVKIVQRKETGNVESINPTITDILYVNKQTGNVEYMSDDTNFAKVEHISDFVEPDWFKSAIKVTDETDLFNYLIFIWL